MDKEKESGWTIGPSRVLERLPYFELRSHAVAPPGGNPAEFYYMQGPDWVKVLPLTDQNEVLLIQHFRPVTGIESLEIPGGLMDPTDQSPLAAAARELQEETGCLAGSIESLGSFYPNPALFNLSCHCFLARNVQPAGITNREPGEQISTLRVPLAELPMLIGSGKIVHSLVIATFSLFFAQQKVSEQERK